MLSVNSLSNAWDYISPKPLSQSSRNLDARTHFLDQMKCFPKHLTRPSHLRHCARATRLLEPKEAERDRRRQDFLRKVRQASDDKKWQARGDQILREDYVSRQKQWEEEQARAAPETPMGPDDDEEEEEIKARSYGGREGVEIMDDILLHEDQEFDALISLLHEPSSTAEQKGSEKTDFETDDEEYAWLCMEAVSATEAAEAVAGDPPEPPVEPCEDMDMSTG